MKLTVDAKSFSEAIKWVTKTYDAKETNSYIALIINSEGNAHLFHMNNTSFMKSPFQVLDIELEKNESDGLSFALEGQFLERLGSTLNQPGPIEIINDNKTLNVKSATGRFTIPMLETNIGQEPEMISLGEVDDREYFDSLQRLSKLCDPANAGTIPVLGTVDIKLDHENNKAIMMATDRYALGEITIDYDSSENAEEYVEENGNVLLPVENAVLIPPSKGLTSSTTLVYETKGKKFGYIFGDKRVAVFALKDAKPLDYTKLKTRASEAIKNTVLLDSSDLKKAIQTISNLSWEETSIYFTIDAERLIVSDSTGDNKLSVDLEESDLVEDEFSVKFIRSIINEAFSPISTKKMKLKWAHSTSPFVLEPVLDDGEVVDEVFVFAMPSN